MENGKKEKKLFVIYPQKRAEEGRLDQVLRAALEGISAQVVDSMEELWENGDHENGTERFQGCRILFAVPLGKNGVNRGYYEVLAWLRCGKPVLEGALAGFLIDADSELYTKAAARELAVAANQAGAALVGRPLVEGTASLDNYIIQAANMGTDRLGGVQKKRRDPGGAAYGVSMEPQERAPSAGTPCLQPQDLQYPGGLERGLT